jgi:hypothetical protein
MKQVYGRLVELDYLQNYIPLEEKQLILPITVNRRRRESRRKW